MQDREPEEELIQQTEQELKISGEEGRALVPARSQSPIESLNVLISREESTQELKKLLELKEIALKQQLEQNQIQELKDRQSDERLRQRQKERTITIASSVTIVIGLGIMYSPSSQLVGTFILLLGLATILRIPFDELNDEFIKFVDKISQKISKILPPKS